MPRTAQILLVCLSLVTGVASASSPEQAEEVTRADQEPSAGVIKQVGEPVERSRPEGLSRMQVLGQIVAGALTGAFMAVLTMRFVFRWHRKRALPFGSVAKRLARWT